MKLELIKDLEITGHIIYTVYADGHNKGSFIEKGCMQAKETNGLSIAHNSAIRRYDEIKANAGISFRETLLSEEIKTIL